MQGRGGEGLRDSPDSELVGMARGGSREAYGELVTRYQGHVYALAYSLVGDWADAQDAAQEAFIRAYGNLDQLRDPGRFAPWLRRVTFGVSMDWLRARRPELFRALDGRVDLDRLEIPDFRPGPPAVAESRELARAVLHGIDSLPPRYRVPLTMFHLDGLSYQKVADFLDIPLGTAKSLIHRARRKLAAILAAHVTEEISLMVQEALNEHRLPDEFVQKVLDNVPLVGFHTGCFCLFAGCMASIMEYLGDPVGYDLLMGVSGGAWYLLWEWSPDNVDLLILGEEPVRRTFAALGYNHEVVLGRPEDPSAGAGWRERIAASVRGGRPAIAMGVVGPPECCVVAGYDRRGEVLVGHSYFHDGSRGYFRKGDWYDECHGVILVGDKGEAPPRQQVLQDALEYAIRLGRSRELAVRPAGREPLQRTSGLAAYEAWADAMLDDSRFPKGDPEALEFARMVHEDALCVLMGRRAGAGFLRSMAEVEPAARDHLLAAAEACEAEADLLTDKACCASGSQSQRARRLADRAYREETAALIRRAGARHSEALDHMGAALAGRR
jgi:RNA polymerase sigma-70 factor (ECF subfamily)